MTTVTSTGELIELNPEPVEDALNGGEAPPETSPQEAWDSWVDGQLQALDKKIGRPLTSKEVEKLYERANSHREPNPDLGRLFDEEFPGRRDNRDGDIRRDVIREIAEDTHAEQQAEEQANQHGDGTDGDRQAEMVAAMDEAADDGE